MALTTKTINSAGLYPAISASTVAVKASGVTLQAAQVDAQGQLPYGVEVKRNMLLQYYGRTGIQGKTEIQRATKKGILAPGKDFLLNCSPESPCEIHHCGQDGVFLSGTNFHVEGLHAHHLGVRAYSSTLPHADGIQVAGGSGVISLCKIDLPDLYAQGFASNACIYIESDFAPIGEVFINSSELLGAGTNYSLFAVVGKYGPPKRVEVFNTKIAKGKFGHTNWDMDRLPPWLHFDSSCAFI